MPDVTANYYFPKAHTQFTVTQTIGCSLPITNSHRLLRSVISVAAATTNVADLDWQEGGKVKQGRFAFRSLKGTFSDGDATVALTPDGRLASVNSTTAGQGNAIIKDLVTVAGAAMMLGGAPAASFTPNDEDNACAKIDQLAAVGAKPDAAIVTLTYGLSVAWGVSAAGKPHLQIDKTGTHDYDSYTGELTAVDVVEDPASKPAYDAIKSALKDRLALRLVIPEQTLHYMSTIENGRNVATKPLSLELTRVAIVTAAIEGSSGSMTRMDRIWVSNLPVPTHETYAVPMPSSGLFGKSAFGIGLADNNSITSIHYGQNSGAPDALDAAGAILTAVRPKTAAEKAAEVQGQADLIAQQRRLVACEVAPDQCT